MDNIAVLGMQWGDEGKARAINWLAKDYDVVCRFGAGGNAGHTLYYKGQKIVRHLIPSADFSIKSQKAFLGAGMVINLESLLKEVLETEAMFPGSAKRIIVDPDAFVILPKHTEEDKVNSKSFGSTGQGITPCYVDKIGRRGTKIKDLLRDNSDITNALSAAGVVFAHSLEMYEELMRSRIIFEGAQSILLDYNFGDYPFVTSGECGIGGIYNAGLAFVAPKKVIGVFKPYMTKVDGGVGSFITEMPEDDAKVIQEIGQEVGATTGRTRRVGYLDLMALEYAIQKGGVNSLFITKMDILDGTKSVKVCNTYGDGVRMVSGSQLRDAKPGYLDLPGWKSAKDSLQTKSFINYVEIFTKCQVDYISAGVNPEDVIEKKKRRLKPSVDLFQTVSDY